MCEKNAHIGIIFLIRLQQMKKKGGWSGQDSSWIWRMPLNTWTLHILERPQWHEGVAKSSSGATSFLNARAFDNCHEVWSNKWRVWGNAWAYEADATAWSMVTAREAMWRSRVW